MTNLLRGRSLGFRSSALFLGYRRLTADGEPRMLEWAWSIEN